MFRWIVVTVLLSASAVAGVWWLAPHLISAPPTAATPPAGVGQKPPPPVRAEPVVPSRSSSAASATRGQPEIFVYRNPARQSLSEPIFIPGATLVIVQKQDVPAEKDGEVLFVGTDDVEDVDKVPPEKKLPDAELGFLAVRLEENEPLAEGETRFHLKGDPVTWYRRVRDREELPPRKIVLSYETRHVRKLQVGDRVHRGQLLALVNPRSAFDDVTMKVAKLNKTDEERLAASSQKDIFYDRLRRLEALNQRQPGSVSYDDLQTVRGKYDEYYHQERVKKEEIGYAQRELNDSLTKLKMHEVRAAIDGVVQVIYKNHQGEAVKPLEAVLRIENPARLRVEGRLEQQEAEKLQIGMPVTIEASRPEAPRLVISGHLGAVNGVAVSKGTKDKRPTIVSGSDDETLRGWDSVTGERLWLLGGLRSAVRAVACSPADSQRNLVCFGCADGTVRLLDLDDVEKKPLEMSERHRRAVHGIAFSPKGDVIATCSDDRSICLWKTETGALLHRLVNAHSGPVTSVRFATDKRLVSAGEDKRLIVWDVEAGKPPRAIGPRFDGRGGEVQTLDVSPDGKTVLFDQGKELRLLTLEDNKQIAGSLQNPSDELDFSTMALFSPDGKTILTNGAAPGRLQLWRVPVRQTRGSELRKFIWSSDKGTATSGAFAADGSFAVTGTLDHKVLVWSMPSKEEVESRLEARLTYLERSLDTRSRHVRVWAELEGPEWLLPGMQATMVIQPLRK
jgi:WD40 repeat protein